MNFDNSFLGDGKKARAGRSESVRRRCALSIKVPLRRVRSDGAIEVL
jgi:hypothetical protein